jgi:N-acetylmuramoyl-L-alanine amidase
MSAIPTRVDWEATMPDPCPPLQEGNRVLESIGRQEALRALRAFSELHEQIRNRRMATGRASNRDLFETERFILDEVLQLICDRALAITQADGIVVALGEEPEIIGPTELVCRAAAGELGIKRGIYLNGESKFLRECLETGNILRSDDCEIDARVEQDFARTIGARSTVMVPLGSGREPLGVLQAFSTTAWAFSDDNMRCLDLFAELVLSALKPENQDRRIDWLSSVTNEILGVKPVTAVTVAEEPAATEIPQCVETVLDSSPVPETISTTELSPAAELPVPEAIPEQAVLTEPVVVPEVPEVLTLCLEPVVELVEPSVTNTSTYELVNESLAELYDDSSDDILGIEEPSTPTEQYPSLPFLQELSVPSKPRPVLRMVMGLAAVVALFSAGAWWGMQVHGKTESARAETAEIAARRNAIARSSATTSATAADLQTSAVSDNLTKADSGDAQLTAVAEDKLASLPKVTGVRHWSSSMGSTVVIDMDDQVPYEVHRLMSPERIYFDLHDTSLSPELDGKTMEVGDASLVRVRMAQPVAGVTRIVLDTKDGSNFAVSMESSPYRLVVELRGSEKNLAANQFAPKDATKLAAASAKAAPGSGLTALAKTGKFRIVLDAGHGGWDRGTVGQQGLLEKDLVLDVTRRLGKLLQARLGSEVMFTRTDDTYLPLDQRADLANQSQADLFVSVHANYSSSAAARGVETYYTNVFSAPGSREAEKHDDGTTAKLTPASLSSGELLEKTERSRRLAESVQRSLYGTVAASSPDIRNRGIKDSAFAVLTGTTMPSILTEISFVSSPADERKLQSAEYREQIAEALYQGISRYQKYSSHAKVAQLQTATVRR